MYQELSDKELFKHISTDDMLAFEELYERYHSILFLYTVKRIFDEQEAFDIVQDVLLNIWQKRSKLIIKESLKNYLIIAIKNKILDKITHVKVQDKYLKSLENIIQTAQASDYLIREKELNAIIEKEIASMPPRMREIFLLSREQDLTNYEIASTLSLSKLTVDTQIKRALRLLRGKLETISHFLFMCTYIIHF